MRAFVSVDWDFFVRSLYSWDWGHSESSFFMAGGMWEIRAAGFFGAGINIEEEMSPARYANPKPESFWNILKQLGYDFSVLDRVATEFASNWVEVPNFVVSDSHSTAGPVFVGVADEIGPPDVIINFDAHHDMGYGDKAKIKQKMKQGVCSCDMWLLALMDRYKDMDLRANIVYPNWMLEERSLEEEWKQIKTTVPPKVLKRTKIGTFIGEDGSVSDVVKPDDQIEVEALFICRSSAWVPPWLDKKFIEFVESAQEALQEFENVNLHDYHCEEEGHIRPLEVREDFSMDRARAMGNEWKTLMAMQKTQ